MDKLEDAAAVEQAPVASKERTSAKPVLRLGVSAVMSFLITTTALGYLLGRTNSPDWEHPVQATKFMASHHNARFLVAVGRPALLESDPIELRLRAGDRQLVYRTDTDKIIEELLPVRELQALPNQLKQSKDDHQALIHTGGALAAAGVIAKAQVSVGNWLGKVRNGKMVGVAAAAAVVGAGAAWGYHKGYRGEPDYSSKAFQEMLHDKLRWRHLAAQYRSAATSRGQSKAIPSGTP